MTSFTEYVILCLQPLASYEIYVNIPQYVGGCSQWQMPVSLSAIVTTTMPLDYASSLTCAPAWATKLSGSMLLVACRAATNGGAPSSMRFSPAIIFW